MLYKLSYLWHKRILHTGSFVLLALLGKWHLLSPLGKESWSTRSSNSNMSTHSMIQGHQERYNTQPYSETTLTHTEKRQNMSFNSGHWSHMAGRFHPTVDASNGLHSPLMCCKWSTHLPYPQAQNEHSKGLARCQITNAQAGQRVTYCVWNRERYSHTRK